MFNSLIYVNERRLTGIRQRQCDRVKMDEIRRMIYNLAVNRPDSKTPLSFGINPQIAHK